MSTDDPLRSPAAVPAPAEHAARPAPGPGAPDVHINRLRLQVVGLDEGAARSLAKLVAEGLAPGLGRAATSGRLDSLRSADRTQVRVTAPAGSLPAAGGAGDQQVVLAGAVVDEIVRALAAGDPGEHATFGPAGVQ